EPAGMTTIGLSYSLVKISTKCAPALEPTPCGAGEVEPVDQTPKAEGGLSPIVTPKVTPQPNIKPQ
ncbi:hypothetical protein, partial [Aeromonas sp. QDB05]|uniref:hypothetical protein n=1 Tax=Aeromonas sp. QDB05 TaxID=2990478 RepID=UPI0022E7A28C